MNNIVMLKGAIQDESHTRFGGGISFPKGKDYPIGHLNEIRNQLVEIREFWKKHDQIGGILLSVHYKKFVPKSGRVTYLLGLNSIESAKASIRGVKFALHDVKPEHHIITHFFRKDHLDACIDNLKYIIDYLKNKGWEWIREGDFRNIEADILDRTVISKTKFKVILRDAAWVEKINIEQDVEEVSENGIVSFYRTAVPVHTILSKLGVNLMPDDVLDSLTVRLDPHNLDLIKAQVPYLISMQARDLTLIPEVISVEQPVAPIKIPDPKDEPIIGVLDTQVSKQVYFSKWIESHNELEESDLENSQHFKHGTQVCSIIVDGPTSNPKLQDGCGRFRVRHFGIAREGRNSVVELLKKIKTIVISNPDIVVWNLSLGASTEIRFNSISPAAAVLDELAAKYNVIFVVAATNRPWTIKNNDYRIGSPADAVNGLTVGAVNGYGQPTTYTRQGPALHYFIKPDVAYFGGEGKECISVCNSLGEAKVIGTSFAAPWISRKLAFLIHKMGFSREVAKALIIDSALGWKKNMGESWKKIGFGVVPTHINNILRSENNEIRFIIHGVASKYHTFHYMIPIPKDENGKFSFDVRATMCYFPDCSREQGVDYTTNELSFRFGRVKVNKGKPEIKRLNEGTKREKIFEKELREIFQKWQNVKVERQIISRGLTAYTDAWGFAIEMVHRDKTVSKKQIPFSIVVTLREINDVNRMGVFKKLCQIKGWSIETVDIDERLKIQESSQEELVFN